MLSDKVIQYEVFWLVHPIKTKEKKMTAPISKEVPEDYDSHAEFISERLRDDLRSQLDDLTENADTVENILDQITQSIYDTQEAMKND